MALPKGTEEKYELIEKLGQGGMGEVYKVRHRLLDDVRVIKVIRTRENQAADLGPRFLEEARAATRLRHRRLAQVFDFAVGTDSAAHLVMEYIDGMTLGALLQQETILASSAVDLAIQALDGLSYLHRQGYVHRDVSPDNLMVTLDGEGRVLVKLIDLGLAKRLEASSHMTESGVFVGKILYASPEQFGSATKSPDPRSDLYSLGLVLYEMLTGVRAIEGESFSELVAAHLVHPPRPFAESDPQGLVPAGLRSLVRKAIDKDPSQRLPSAEDFIAGLEPFASGDLSLLAELLCARRDRNALSGGTDREAGSPPISRTEATMVDPESAARIAAQSASLAAPGPDRRGRLFRIFALVGLLVGLGLGLWWAGTAQRRTRLPESPTVLVDASPWARVRVFDETGAEVGSEDDRYTPTSLRLPAGSYRVELESPSGDTRSVELDTTTADGQPLLVEFEATTHLDAYFEQVGLGELLAEAGAP